MASADDDPTDALRQIAAWADAYSDAACETMTDEQLARAVEALAAVGISVEAFHARWARTLVEDLGRLAREGLEVAEGRRVMH